MHACVLTNHHYRLVPAPRLIAFNIPPLIKSFCNSFLSPVFSLSTTESEEKTGEIRSREEKKGKPISPFFKISSGLALIMSVMEMASTTRLSYKRLRNEGGPADDDEDDEEEEVKAQEERSVNWRARKWFRIRKVAGKKRPKVRIPGLRKFLRRKHKVVSAARVSWSNVFRRLKESRSYMGDLFAGNYLFMQVTPSPLRCADKSYMGVSLHSFTSNCSLGKISYY